MARVQQCWECDIVPVEDQNAPQTDRGAETTSDAETLSSLARGHRPAARCYTRLRRNILTSHSLPCAGRHSWSFSRVHRPNIGRRECKKSKATFGTPPSVAKWLEPLPYLIANNLSRWRRPGTSWPMLASVNWRGGVRLPKGPPTNSTFRASLKSKRNKIGPQRNSSGPLMTDTINDREGSQVGEADNGCEGVFPRRRR